MIGRMWYYMQGEQQMGPVRLEELDRLLIHGQIPADTYVWAEGMEQWQPANQIGELGLPPSLTDSMGMPIQYGSDRPTPVTVFGILNIVFGGLGLLCMPCMVTVIFAPSTPGSIAYGPMMTAYLAVAQIVGLICAGVQVATGIGLLYLKRWARQWAYGYGWFAVAWGIIGIAVNIIVIPATLQGVSEEMMPSVVGGLVGGTCGGVIGLVYPVLLVIFMNRPNVIDACRR